MCCKIEVKKFPLNKWKKEGYKVKDSIINIPFKLHSKHHRRGVLRTL